MVKQDAQYAKNLTAHVKKLVTRYKPEEPPATDPVVQLVLALLNWNHTTKAAEQAYEQLITQMVDINELRVSSVDELLGFMDPDYPDARERLLRIRAALHEVYVREYAVAMTSAMSKGKKEQRQYLDTLPGIPPYAAAQVMLLSFNGHAMPVDDKLAALLIREGCLEEGTTPADAENFMLKHIKAAEALTSYLALQAWADACKMPADARPALHPSVVGDPAMSEPATANARRSSSKRKKVARKK